MTTTRTTTVVLALFVLFATCFAPSLVRAQNGHSKAFAPTNHDPAVPPGIDPGGVAVALITTGIDYTDPEIASRLARDGEGQIIGWDFIDNDITPYDTDAEANALAKLLLATNPKARLVPLRVDPKNPSHLAWAVMFVARTPARIAAVPFANSNKSQWAPFVGLVRSTTNTLFVLSAGTMEDAATQKPIWPAAARLDGAVVAAPYNGQPAERRNVDAWVTTGNSIDKDLLTSAQAVILLSANASCVLKNVADQKFSNELRDLLLASAKSSPGDNSIRLHGPACK